MKYFDEPIYVTRPYLPDLEEFKQGLGEVWANQWLTNNGPMVRRFHSELASYFRIPETNLALFNNGTLALELGYYAMGLSGGEVITTPFTFVATSHALRRIGATPIFADIDPETLCLDPRRVESLITSRTKAIVPVHVYGNVCDTDAFESISKRYGIPVIYDAAHAFGVKGVETVGAMSMFSFHPTKIFHSCEGGLLVFKDPSLQEKLFNLRNFAIHGELNCVDVGSNAKMNELQALMGLCCLKHIQDILNDRRRIYEVYAEVFRVGRDFHRMPRLISFSGNKAYVPLLFDSYETRERVYTVLKEKCNVYTRRYFYPILTDFPPYRYAQGTCPVAENVAARVLTLPIYYGLSSDAVRNIAQNVLEIVK